MLVVFVSRLAAQQQVAVAQQLLQALLYFFAIDLVFVSLFLFVVIVPTVVTASEISTHCPVLARQIAEAYKYTKPGQLLLNKFFSLQIT